MTENVPLAPVVHSEVGSHGTCESFADAIVATNEFKSGKGIRGSGAYFWSYSDYYLLLAKSWYKQHFSKGVYSAVPKNGPAILTVEIQYQGNEVLDLYDRRLKQKIGTMATKIAKGSTSPADIAKGYDKAISVFESTHKVSVKVILTEVTGPHSDNCKYYNYASLGPPGCIIARISDIIKKITKLSQNEIDKLKI